MPEERRLVSVLFADVVGSTALGSETDPELLRDQMTRYFDRMKEVAEVNGGTVEKFIGDAVMVVFGIPRLHDDDAERAVRCGLAMQATIAELNRELGTDISMRVGINSGEAVVKSDDDGQFIVGDPVNLAARLQQGAEPAEVIVGSLTKQLTGAAVEYAPRSLPQAKGKLAPISAFRAVRTKSSVPREFRGTASIRTPLVGRERELQLLLDTFGRVVEDSQAHLFTLVGNAGVGKSRLIEEGLTRIKSRFSPQILQGRCLPYGKGVSYWPLMEIVRQDASISPEDHRETAVRNLDDRLASLGLSPEVKQGVARRLAVLLGVETSDAAVAESSAQVPAELAWAIRRYIEAIATRKPVVLIIDDLQWADGVILDLVEQVTERSTAIPVLWICVARPEFMEDHPHWGAGRPNGSLITVNPLNSVETSTLISRLLEIEEIPQALHRAILERSGGNPLFCEEFLRMVIEEQQLVRVEDRWSAPAGALDVRVPETIHTLLAARLDALPEAQKRTLRGASIIGERFTADQVKTLLIDLDVDGALLELLRKGLVLEDSATTDAGLRFKHLLFRDVAYGALAKKDRADLHHRFATYLDSVRGDRGAEYPEIIGYHASRAFELSREMRLSDDLLQARAELALAWHLFLGERALARGELGLLADHIASCGAAFEAIPRKDRGAEWLRLRLLEAESLRGINRYDEAMTAANEVTEQSVAIERWDLAARAQLCAAQIEHRRDPTGALSTEHASEAARLFRLAGDAPGILETEWLSLVSRIGSGEGTGVIDEAVRLADRAAALGDKPRAAFRLSIAAVVAANGGMPRHAQQYVARSLELAQQAGARPSGWLVIAQATLEAMSGDINRAVSRLHAACAEDSVDAWESIFLQRTLALCLNRAGRFAEADAVLQEALSRSTRSGETWNRSELFARRALTGVARGELDSAEGNVQQALHAAVPGDRSGALESNWALAELRAALGRDEEAEAAYRKALTIMNGVPFYDVMEDVNLSYARFLVSRGRGHDAIPLLDATEAWLDAAGYTFGRDEIASLRRQIGE
ncbi:MAG: AAA family ATPase [Candidatus Dormibacteria bacterium]